MKCPFIMNTIGNQNWEASKYVWTFNFWNSTPATFYWEFTDFIVKQAFSWAKQLSEVYMSAWSLQIYRFREYVSDFQQLLTYVTLWPLMT